MPAHIYVRVGRWGDAATQNELAIQVDREYRAKSPQQHFYRIYMAHNHHMLTYAGMMSGQSALALQRIREMVKDIPLEFFRANPWADGFMAMPLEVLMRFGRWQQILAELPDWPRDASMMVVGSFRPRSGGVLGAPVAFRVFLEAEVEVELEMYPPLVIGSAGPQDVTVTVDPAALFRSGAQVVDLSRFNGRVVEWEVEHGFRESHGGRR